MNSQPDTVNEHSTLRIVHALPGRLRFRGPAHVMTEELADAIRNLAGVRSCSRSTRTGSILVLFEPDAITAEAITQAAARPAGLDEHSVVNVSHQHSAAEENGRTRFGASVAEAFGQLDRRVLQTTRGLIGLGALVPVVLTLWAVREIALGRTAPLSWSSALWYAHGLFRDYNNPSPN
ncbi:MAG: hypothetical protein C5B48_05145 [Candidatus Rokuibacteriota bacterium]|nr:MAG: hypothetical protein C5B48_05145 [Candidatus Rokubacteria bacterium]